MVVLRASEWALKRFVKFILKRTLSKIIGNNDGSARESLASIDIALSEGILELKDVELNTIFVRDALFSSFINSEDGNENDSISIASAKCGKIKIKIPWNSLYSDRCELLIEDVAVLVVRRSARGGESAEGGEMKKKHPERIRKDKTLLHIYDNNDLNSHSENVKEIERAQKLNKDEDDDVVKGVGEGDASEEDEKTTEPGAVMKAIKRLIRGALLSVRNISFDFDTFCNNNVDEKSIVSLLIESGAYVHDGQAIVNMRSVELRVGEHVVLSPFHAQLSKREDESEHSTYALSIENSIHASLTERTVHAFSQLCEKSNEKGDATGDSEAIENLVKEEKRESGEKEKCFVEDSRMNALNKSFLDCILEVKKRNRTRKVGDKNGNEHSFVVGDDDGDDEFYDCESSEHSNDLDIEKFTRSVISSFYEESVSRVQSQADSIIVPSSTYCIAFESDSKVSMEWDDGSNLYLAFDRSSRFVYCESSLMKLFAPRIAMTLQVDQSSPILSLEIVSDEVLPVVSIINKKISPEEERITTLTLSSVGAELFLDGETFIRIPELAHQVFTLTNRNTRNQYSARDAAFASTTDETMDIANSAEQILELARASSIQYSMTSTHLDVFFTRTRMGQIDTSLNSFRNLPDVHPFKLKQNEIGDVVDSFSIDLHIDSLDVNIDGKSEASLILPEESDVFASASEKLPSLSSRKGTRFHVCFTEVAFVAALAVCGDQDANFLSFTSSRISSYGGDDANRRILAIDTCAVQLSKLPVLEDCAYSQISSRIFANTCDICLGRSSNSKDKCSRDGRALFEALVYSFGMDYGDTSEEVNREEQKNTSSVVVAVSACVNFQRIQAIARDATSTVIVETKRIGIHVAPNEDTFKVHENFLKNQKVFATHVIDVRVRDSFTVRVNDVTFLSFRDDVDACSSLVFAFDAEYSPDGKSTVIFSFDRPCDVSMYESHTIATIRSGLDCIMGSTRDKQDILSKANIEREERDENDLEYVFIRQPRKRRDNFKEEERSKIAFAATTKALQDASKADFEMNLDSKDVANCRRNVQDSNASSRHSTANEKINVLSLCRSSRVHGFGGDCDGIFSNRKTVRFLPLPLNAPESSSLSVHAFAKSIDVTLHNGAENACRGLRMEIKNISNRFDIFEASSRWGYHLVCDGDSINVVDLTPNVAWPNIYSRRIEREPTGVANSDVQIMLTGVRCDAEDTTLGACEIALKFSLCPARVRLEQSVVKTLLDFMTSAFADGDEDSDDDGFCGSFDSESNDGDVSNHNTYFQLVEVTPWSLRLDYCANENVDVYALTAGNYLEALNLIPWGGVSLEFPTFRLVGISGVRNMLHAISSRIIDCVTKDQAHKFVKAFAPVQSANRVTSAAKDIYKNPLAYKQRKGDAARSSRMFGEVVLSTARFCKAVSLEALKLGEFVSGNASAVLEAAENLLDGEEVRREKRTDRDRMPDGIADGVSSARHDFIGGVVKAKNAVVRDPLRKFQTPKDYGGGAKAAAKTLIKNAPRAGIAALSGTTKATNKVIVGVKNTLFDDSSTSSTEKRGG